jgi:hypothetical protein
MNATFEGVESWPVALLLNPIAACFVPAVECRCFCCSICGLQAPAREPKARLSDYLDMDGHLNRRQFNRCVWVAAFMLMGSAAAILGTIGYFAK